MDYERVLVFGAHPDDEMTMAATMAKMVSAGTQLYICIMTDGCEGYPKPEWKDKIVAMRKQEQADPPAGGRFATTGPPSAVRRTAPASLTYPSRCGPPRSHSTSSGGAPGRTSCAKQKKSKPPSRPTSSASGWPRRPSCTTFFPADCDGGGPMAARSAQLSTMVKRDLLLRGRSLRAVTSVVTLVLCLLAPGGLLMAEREVEMGLFIVFPKIWL